MVTFLTIRKNHIQNPQHKDTPHRYCNHACLVSLQEEEEASSDEGEFLFRRSGARISRRFQIQSCSLQAFLQASPASPASLIGTARRHLRPAAIRLTSRNATSTSLGVLAEGSAQRLVLEAAECRRALGTTRAGLAAALPTTG